MNNEHLHRNIFSLQLSPNTNLWSRRFEIAISFDGLIKIQEFWDLSSSVENHR